MISIVRYHSVLNPPHLKPGCHFHYHWIWWMEWYWRKFGKSLQSINPTFKTSGALLYPLLVLGHFTLGLMLTMVGFQEQTVKLFTPFYSSSSPWFMQPSLQQVKTWFFSAFFTSIRVMFQDHCLVGAALSLLNTAAPLLSLTPLSMEGLFLRFSVPLFFWVIMLPIYGGQWLIV